VVQEGHEENWPAKHFIIASSATIPFGRRVSTTRFASVVRQRGIVFHDASCLAALVDRFAQHCHTVDIDVDPWRHKEAQERSGKTKKKARRDVE
jgi:hypothetical protein